MEHEDPVHSAYIPPSEREQTLGEEIANAVSHGIGAILATACLVVAVVFASIAPHPDPWTIVSVSVYGTTMVLLYLFSTLYHALNRPKTKAVMNYFDHCTIYLLIAGSYTPFCLAGIRPVSPGWGWAIFAESTAASRQPVILPTVGRPTKRLSSTGSRPMRTPVRAHLPAR